MKRSDGPARDRVDAWLDRLRLDDGDGPALPITDDAALELVRRARERCEPAPRARLSRLPKWPLIGIGVVVASSAAAAALGELPAWLARVAPTETRAPDVAATSGTEKKAPKPAHPREVSAQPPVASPVESPAPVEPPASELPRREPALREPAPAAMAGGSAPARAPEPPVALAAPKRSARHEASEARAATAPAPEVNTELGPRVVAPHSPRAADLLGVANRARAERQYAAALTTYREVLERYPQTRQAQIAAVAAGELELERGNARAAEPLFQHVPHDAELGAEALFGLSEAYRARARVVEERRALDRFVQLYPSNPLAAAARQRLSQLEAAMSARAPR